MFRCSPTPNHNPFDFGARLRFDAATETKIKISSGTRKAEISRRLMKLRLEPMSMLRPTAAQMASEINQENCWKKIGACYV